METQFLGISALTAPPNPKDILETPLEFPDNLLLIELCGEVDRNLAQVEHAVGVQILRRGNQLAIIGEAGPRSEAAVILQELYAKLEAGRSIEPGDVDGAIRLVERQQGTVAGLVAIAVEENDRTDRYRETYSVTSAVLPGTPWQADCNAQSLGSFARYAPPRTFPTAGRSPAP